MSVDGIIILNNNKKRLYMQNIQTETVSSENKVLSNTFNLTALALFFSSIVGFSSNALGLTAAISNIWVFLALFVGAIFLIFYVSKNADSGKGVFGVFAFAGIYGLMLDPLVSQAIAVNSGAVTSALLSTAIITLLMSIYARTTKKDLSGLGSYLFVGIIALIIASIINIFLGSSVLHFAISAIGTLIFSLYILYDVNRIVTGGETNYVSASLGMFINIVGLFVHLLNLFLLSDD